MTSTYAPVSKLDNLDIPFAGVIQEGLSVLGPDDLAVVPEGLPLISDVAFTAPAISWGATSH
jgi:hypothetical protein